GIAGGLSCTLGVLGPTRLHYSRAISIVSYLSEVMTEQVAQHYG
ncbi:MAG TPA: HrcA family transcriptional regulator, partial [Dehalococcoidia bacterium]|nr:HrcA family transcriptional regulator [Dehalococcoidia bacterium]